MSLHCSLLKYTNGRVTAHQSSVKSSAANKQTPVHTAVKNIPQQHAQLDLVLAKMNRRGKNNTFLKEQGKKTLKI